MTHGRTAIPDLAGFYITDARIYAVVGLDHRPNELKEKINNLHLQIEDGTSHHKPRPFYFSDFGGSVEQTFDAACKWVSVAAPNLRSLAAACYGPFISISRTDRDNKHPDYGKLQATSHGELPTRNIRGLIRRGLEKHLPHLPLITIETDVAADALGLIYNWSRNPSQWKTVQNQTIAFIRADLGIGGAFMRTSDDAAWLGQLHPEIGQICVPRWVPSKPELDPYPSPNSEPNFICRKAMNSDSVEGLASINAINQKYSSDSLTFLDLCSEMMADHPAWEREAWYLAQLAWTVTCVVSPSRIVFGGAIMMAPSLLDKIRKAFEQIKGQPGFPYYSELDNLNIYLQAATSYEKDGRILLQHPGVTGALCLAAYEIKPTKANLTVIRGRK